MLTGKIMYMGVWSWGGAFILEALIFLMIKQYDTTGDLVSLLNLEFLWCLIFETLCCTLPI